MRNAPRILTNFNLGFEYIYMHLLPPLLLLYFVIIFSLTYFVLVWHWQCSRLINKIPVLSQSRARAVKIFVSKGVGTDSLMRGSATSQLLRFLRLTLTILSPRLPSAFHFTRPCNPKSLTEQFFFN